MAQPYLDQLERLVAVHLSFSGDVVCKHFFSGAALYIENRICGSLTPKGLAFKLGESRSDDLVTQGLARPLRYFDKSPVKKGYALFPDYTSLSDSELSAFFEESCAGRDG